MRTRSILHVALLALALFVLRDAAHADNDALYQAVQVQDVEAMKKLLSEGADPNYRSGDRPLLAWAAQGGNLEVVDLLLRSSAEPNATDGIGHTPLMRAIDMRHLPIVRRLLDGAADPNAKDRDGKTCLMMAVETSDPELVRALTDAGADATYVTPDGDSPALVAAQSGSLEIIGILGNVGAALNASNAAYTPLSYAIEQGNADLVRALLEAGADPNAKTRYGNAPLHIAVDKPEILTLLLGAKADPDIESSAGTTAIVSAIENGNRDAVEKLLEAGADTTKEVYGGTLVDLAERYSQTEIAQLLKTRIASASELKQPESDRSDPSTSRGAESDEVQISCTLEQAAIMQMEVHGLLQAQVNAGKMSSDIFRTFMEDTTEYGELLVSDPSKACALLQRLKKKYGV